MNVTADYRVARHTFEVAAEEEYLGLMDNYAPFAIDSPAAGHSPVTDPTADEECFSLNISPGTMPVFEEVLRQVDGEQTIVCGRDSEGSHVFTFEWCGVMAGCLVCSEDYRKGRLMPTGRYTKLAIDNALMIMYALATAGEDTLLFHAAVVSYHGKGYMFLGASGTGKSTHARLWVENIDGATLVNDDNPVVRIGADGKVMVYGSPWSGKTRCYRNVGYPLGGIVLLGQAPYNKIHRLNGIKGYAALVAAVSGTRWDRRIADGLHATETGLVGTVPIWRMECLPDRAAAEICQTTICK